MADLPLNHSPENSPLDPGSSSDLNPDLKLNIAALNPRELAKTLSDRALADNDPSAWFDSLYVAAAGDADRVPWALNREHPALRSWLSERPLTQKFPTLGSATPPRALVIGCGLGDDAEAIAAVGFHVTAFDISTEALAWCRRRFPHSSVTYCQGDLLNPDPAWAGQFDLVFECRNIQALPLSVRDRAIANVVQPVAPGGTLVIVSHTRPTPAPPSGPPWPLSAEELSQFAAHGWQRVWERTFREAGMSDRVCLEFQREL